MKAKKTYQWWCNATHGDRGEETHGGRQGTIGEKTREEPRAANTHHE